jgi:hypothetical protein
VPTGRQVAANEKGIFEISGAYATYYYEVKR